MITLSNGHQFQFMVASGALGYDGLGWPHERPLCRSGLIRPKLFTVATKTLTLDPDPGDFRWWKFWKYARLIPDNGAVNRIGLRNPGIAWWYGKMLTNSKRRPPLVVSIWGDEDDLEVMALTLELLELDLVGIEVNASCPNRTMPDVDTVVRRVKIVHATCKLPLIVKVSVAQDYCEIAKRLTGIAQAVSLNSVPWEIAFPGKRSPLWQSGRGGGGVSGGPAQEFNWYAVEQLAKLGVMPVIAPSIMEYGDLAKVDELGADAYSFGAIHLRTPCKPTQIALRWLAEHQQA